MKNWLLSNRDGWIMGHLRGSIGPVICAWGAQGKPDRIAQVLDMIKRTGREPLCLGVAQNGMPRHPLYLKRETPLEPYVWPGVLSRVNPDKAETPGKLEPSQKR